MKDLVSTFPDVFCKFLLDNHIDISLYHNALELPRYFRISTHKEKEDTLDGIYRHILAQLDMHENTRECLIQPVMGMEHLKFYQIRSSALKIDLASALPFRSLAAFGMDISSALAVDLLNIQPDDHVLDLCCAPGTKLSLLCELNHGDRTGTITGVDIDESRLRRVRNICRKMGYPCVRLFLCDGAHFSVKPCDRVGRQTRCYFLQPIHFY
jgi:16S rRNA C967 or C1407 C5-methylase (RsmB/RsmF family)